MAVDTRDKRSSAMSIGPWLHIGPTPDGSLANVADRQHMAFTYSGIDTTVARIGGGITVATQVHRPGTASVQMHQPGSTATQVHRMGSENVRRN